MYTTKIRHLEKNGRVAECPNGGFKSYRYLLESDGMGFTVNKTVIPKGEPQRWHYKNHLEACFCVSGGGILKSLETGASFTIAPDTMYVLDKHDEHTFQALEDTVLISVFNPPLVGNEVHGEDGSYCKAEDYHPLNGDDFESAMDTRNEINRDV